MVFGLLSFPRVASAIVLDWNTLTWTPGALSMTYYATNNAVGGTFYQDNAYSGVGSVTISITGATNNFTTAFPQITNDISGGVSSPTNDALQVWLNSWSSVTQSVKVTITFNGYAQGIDSLTLNIYDIDRGSVFGAATNFTYVDQIRNIQSISPTGTTNAPVSITTTGGTNTTFVVAAATTLTNTLTGIATNPDSNNWGNAVVTLTNVSSVSFIYGNSPTNTNTDPFAQAISFGVFSFTPHPKAPEVHPALAGVLICGLVVLLRENRRRSLWTALRNVFGH